MTTRDALPFRSLLPHCIIIFVFACWISRGHADHGRHRYVDLVSGMQHDRANQTAIARGFFYPPIDGASHLSLREIFSLMRKTADIRGFHVGELPEVLMAFTHLDYPLTQGVTDNLDVMRSSVFRRLDSRRGSLAEALVHELGHGNRDKFLTMMSGRMSDYVDEAMNRLIDRRHPMVVLPWSLHSSSTTLTGNDQSALMFSSRTLVENLKYRAMMLRFAREIRATVSSHGPSAFDSEFRDRSLSDAQKSVLVDLLKSDINPAPIDKDFEYVKAVAFFESNIGALDARSRDASRNSTSRDAISVENVESIIRDLIESYLASGQMYLDPAIGDLFGRFFYMFGSSEKDVESIVDRFSEAYFSQLIDTWFCNYQSISAEVDHVLSRRREMQAHRDQGTHELSALMREGTGDIDKLISLSTDLSRNEVDLSLPFSLMLFAETQDRSRRESIIYHENNRAVRLLELGRFLDEDVQDKPSRIAEFQYLRLNGQLPSSVLPIGGVPNHDNVVVDAPPSYNPVIPLYPWEVFRETIPKEQLDKTELTKLIVAMKKEAVTAALLQQQLLVGALKIMESQM